MVGPKKTGICTHLFVVKGKQGLIPVQTSAIRPYHTVVVQSVSEDILVDVGRQRVIAILPALSGAPFRAADEAGFAVLIGALVTCQNHLEWSKINKKKDEHC